MQIQLNNKPLCTIDEAQLSDVYQLLGKHSVTFHLNKAGGILNIMNPLQGRCVVLESRMTEVVDRLFYPVQSLLSEVGLNVTIVESEATRKQVLSRPNTQQQGIWINAMPDEAMEVSIHYFLHRMKQGKRLSQLLMMNMMKYSDIPICRTGLNWKGYSYKISLLGHPWTSVVLAYGGFLCLSVEQLSLLSHAITRGVAFYFSNFPVLDIVEQLREMEKMKAKVIEETNRDTSRDHLATEGDEVIPLPRDIEREEQVNLGDIEESAGALDNKASCIVSDEHRDDQEETNEFPQLPLTACTFREPEDDGNMFMNQVSVKQKNDTEQVELNEQKSGSERVEPNEQKSGSEWVEPDQAGEQEQVSPAYSLFTWMQVNADHKEAGETETRREQPISLFTFMNQHLSVTQERKREEQPFNLIMMLREKKKHERSSSEQS